MDNTQLTGTWVVVRTAGDRYHAVLVMPDGRRLTDERCNLDDSPEEAELERLPDWALPADVCGRCFPGTK